MFLAKRFLLIELPARSAMPVSLRRNSLIKSVFAIFPSILFPGLAYADEIGSLRDIQRFFIGIQTILDILIPLVVTLAALVFFWGMIKFLNSAGDPKRREEGKGLMIWGVIALFVMISVWGLTALIGSLFGINQAASVIVPSVPTGSGGGFGGSMI